jgi:ATP-dependent RNA helicase RhlB
MELARQWTVDPTTVEIEPNNIATQNVTQKVYITPTNEKFELLNNIIQQSEVESVIVFANRRDQCRNLYEKLKGKGFQVGLLSGEVPQGKRIKTLEDFKDGKLTTLVATDVAGRGIHIEGISHVVNYTLPEEPEDYVHRIGRTGRAGKNGTSISFACEDDAFLLEPIEKLLGLKLLAELPSKNILP